MKADILIITALQEEQDALKKVFDVEWKLDILEGLFFQHFQLELHGRILNVVAVNQTEMGMVHAAITTTKAVQLFKPKLTSMTGICAGIEGKVQLGDIIIGSQTFDYGSGKYINGKLIPHPTPIGPPNWLLQLLEACSAQEKIGELIKREFSGTKPSYPLGIHHASFGSGAAVVADDKMVEEATRIDRKLFALDMEAYGVAMANALASTTSSQYPCFIVKGAVDFAGIHKNDKYHEYGAYVSAMYIRKFLEFPLSASIFGANNI